MNAYRRWRVPRPIPGAPHHAPTTGPTAALPVRDAVRAIRVFRGYQPDVNQLGLSKVLLRKATNPADHVLYIGPLELVKLPVVRLIAQVGQGSYSLLHKCIVSLIFSKFYIQGVDARLRRIAYAAAVTQLAKRVLQNRAG